MNIYLIRHSEKEHSRLDYYSDENKVLRARVVLFKTLLFHHMRGEIVD